MVRKQKLYMWVCGDCSRSFHRQTITLHPLLPGVLHLFGQSQSGEAAGVIMLGDLSKIKTCQAEGRARRKATSSSQ